tara:strand:- start:271 stop:483 length:213 start_codon:yes stop_codon:yes gene_type:complete
MSGSTQRDTNDRAFYNTPDPIFDKGTPENIYGNYTPPQPPHPNLLLRKAQAIVDRARAERAACGVGIETK